MIEKFSSWDSADYLLTDEDLEDYLEACMDEAGDDCDFIVKAHETMARARLGKHH
ncbi:transcriptional regulator [Pseudomonas syringae]|uniref:transcriptional regulator n=1 Tax=Pseudomonas syringae TaxID=317 RepID=UPI001F1CB3E2|nr:transcriptional regulator [Pseudomonas syringae]MCF5702591.1 transcriptional regulator [Pseudomonas syringae]